MGKFIIGLLLGLLAGGGVALYYAGAFPGTHEAVGQPIQPPDPNAQPSPSVDVVLTEQLLNEVLASIFTDLQAPEFALGSQSGGECPGVLTVMQENAGVRSGVDLVEGQLKANVAFSGSYNSMVGCLRFSGWAPANLELRFDPSTRSIYGNLVIQSVNLDGVNPVFTPLITGFVQSTLNTRVNPIEIIKGEQLAIASPVAASEGMLKGQVTDVRSEVVQDAVRLQITYDVSGVKDGAGQTNAPANSNSAAPQ